MVEHLQEWSLPCVELGTTDLYNAQRADNI